jgi:hypothetical protein
MLHAHTDESKLIHAFDAGSSGLTIFMPTFPHLQTGER